MSASDFLDRFLRRHEQRSGSLLAAHNAAAGCCCPSGSYNPSTVHEPYCPLARQPRHSAWQAPAVDMGFSPAPRDWVDYHTVHGQTVPPISGLAYDYLFAGDGVYINAASSLLEARIPVEALLIRGLQPIGSQCRLVHGRIPGYLWDAIMLRVDAAQSGSHEVLVAVAWNAERGYHLVDPDQQQGAWSVEYTPADGWILELHSHRHLRAHPSSIDNHDEQRLRLYGVVGKVDEPVPQVSLRCGAYGYFLPVPWVSVFDGNPDAVDDVNAYALLGLCEDLR